MKNLQEIKSRFGLLIKKYAKRNNVKQLHLASLLGITPSAMSQMLNCQILMNLTQLQLLKKPLKLSDTEFNELQLIIYSMRAGNQIVHSTFNKIMKKERRNRHLTLATLSQNTGIPQTRLKELESNSMVTINIDEAERITKFYDLDIKDLLRNVNIVHENVDSEGFDIELNFDMGVAEHSVEYGVAQNIPILELSELDMFNINLGISSYATAKSVDSYPYKTSEELVAIHVNCKSLETIFPADTIIIVKEYSSKANQLFLGLDNKGHYRVFNHENDESKLFLSSKSSQSSKNFKLKWQLPIHEIIITPINQEILENV